MSMRMERTSARVVLVDKRILEDPRLSWEALGFLLCLLGHESGYEVDLAVLAKARHTDEAAIQSLLAELGRLGYARFQPDNGGTPGGGIWTVCNWETAAAEEGV